MKTLEIRQYDEIKANDRTSFPMLYKHMGRVILRQEHRILEQGINFETFKMLLNLGRMHHKMEQMAARYKALENELLALKNDK